MKRTPVLSALGDSAITISLGEKSGKTETREVRLAAELLRSAGIAQIEEVVPAYTAVTVFYDALHVSYREMSGRILAALDSPGGGDAPVHPRHHSIRVRYDGPDLNAVAAATNLTSESVIEIHSAQTYTVDLLGFVPGFAYLSELDTRLELPRREQPRPRVPAGSVAIAARLTGIYPFDTAGGWHILGNTSEVLFDPHRAEPALLRSGDTVKFEPSS